MRFPRTYVNNTENGLRSFQASLVLPGSTGSITTGTTILAMVSPDKKTALIASDGRVSGMQFIVQEDFCKIFDCRIGFVAGAGDLGLIQQLIPAFRVSLENICNARGKLMSASGAKTHLFHYYRHVVAESARRGMCASLALIALFWDGEARECRLYHLTGMSVLSENEFATTGSGGLLVEGQRIATPNRPTTKEEMVRSAESMIVGAAQKDGATNTNIFCGSIASGEFDLFQPNTTGIWQ